MASLLAGILQQDTLAHLTDNETINCEIVEKILVELVEKLSEAQDRLESTKKRNLPKIEEIKREKREILKEITKLKEELCELDSIKPISTLEKRNNDFKTEGEYISKILNRNIHEEFVTQMKRELKKFMDNLLSTPETIDQIQAQIPGCDELNEKLDQKGVEGLAISVKTEKLLTLIYKCHSEVFNKVYGTQAEEEKRESFKLFCIDLINSFFASRIERKKSSSVTELPQFIALMLNDLTFSSVFIKIHYRHDAAEKLQKLRSNYFAQFLKAQRDEIDCLLQNIPNVKSVKKVSLFLSRLEKVLKPLMLGTDLVNCQFLLLNYAQEVAWNFLSNLKDIAEDELEGLTIFCQELSQLTLKPSKVVDLFYAKKLQTLGKLFKQSLVEIVNCYHRREYSDLSRTEFKGFILAIFASSPLRNEFIREIDVDSEFEFEFEEEEEEEYF